MKRLAEHLPSLKDQVEEITLTDFRRHVGEVMDMCALGKTFAVKRGKRIMGVLTQESNVDLTRHVHPGGAISIVPPKVK